MPEDFETQDKFSARVEGWVSSCEQFDDELTQVMTMSVIPEHVVALSGSPVEQLKALLAWYKQDFFTWTDKPPCGYCYQVDPDTMTSQGVSDPTPEEREGDANRAEVYLCTRCNQVTRFPRYYKVIKLLETRHGRCGEWATCFTAMCRALGHDVRFVVDWTDHVWTEVYIEAESRWVHMDPCENAFDAPKMYERGWGKKLTYVIAVSAMEAVDVTPRYIVNHLGNRWRRTEVPEPWLRQMLLNLRNRLLFGQMEDTIAIVMSRLEQEMLELE